MESATILAGIIGGILGYRFSVENHWPAAFIGFLIGLVSNNMVTAIGIVKVVALPISGVPVAALFLPDRLKWVLYLFPNYWSFEAFNRMFIRTDLPLAPVNLVAALFSLGLVAVLVSRFGRKLRLTVKGGE